MKPFSILKLKNFINEGPSLTEDDVSVETMLIINLNSSKKWMMHYLMFAISDTEQMSK